MENTYKKQKNLIFYVPLGVAFVLWVLGIISNFFTFLSLSSYLSDGILHYVITWRLPVILITYCLLPACLIIFCQIKANKKLFEILMIISFVILGISVLSGIIYAVQWNAYIKGNLTYTHINAFFRFLCSYLPGANFFTNLTYMSNYFTFGYVFRSLLEFINLGNTVFVALIALKLSKTGEAAPKPKYNPNAYAGQINERFQPLSAWQGEKTFAGSPAALISQELSLDKFNNTVLLKIQLKNTGAQNIGAFKFDINCYDPFKTLLGTCQDIVLIDINAAPGVVINTASPVMLPYNQTRIAEVILKSVSFTDGSVWQNEANSLFEEAAQ